MSETAPGRIRDFELLKKLGEGTFGTVYQARAPSGRMVAVKCFKKLSQNQASYLLTSQENEIEALLRVEHPNVVKVLDYGSDPTSGPFVVMELVEGESLRSLGRRQFQMDAFEAIPIILQIADAIAHCHALDILHLDLKPSNVIMTPGAEARMKVLDFGLAHLARMWGTGGQQIRGTLAYMPPESLYDPTPRASQDLYALGVMLFELLSGRLPFDAESQKQRLHDKLVVEPIALPDIVPTVPAAVSDFVGRMLAREPKKRPQTAVAVRHELRRLHLSTLQEGDTVWSVPLGASADLAAGLSITDLVGREKESAHLLERFGDAQRGEGCAVLLRGEAGLGKSRLVNDLLSQREVKRNALVAYGRCRNLDQLVPYSVVRQAILELVSTLATMKGPRAEVVRTAILEGVREGLPLLCQLEPELGELVHFSVPENASLLPLMQVADLIAPLRELLASVAAAAPVLVVLEDLHWADSATLDLVAGLLNPSPPEGVLVVMTARNEWEAPSRVETLDLGRLDDEQTCRQIAALLEQSDTHAASRLVSAVPLLKAGNPLYNVQVVRHLSLEGLVGKNADGSLAFAPALFEGDYSPPGSIAHVLDLTVDRLDAQNRELLGIATLLGRQFRVSQVKRLGVAPESAVDAAIEKACELQLFHVRKDHCLVVHDTVSEQLSAGVPESIKSDTHARIAECLQHDLEPGTLAHHLESAGKRLQAARTYVKAGSHAAELHDPAGAVRHAQKALQLLGEVEQNAERDTLILEAVARLSKSGSMLGGSDEVLAALERAAATIGEPSDRQLAELHSAFARVHYSRGEFLPAVQRSQAVLEMAARDESLNRLSVVPINVLGRALVAAGKFGNAAEMLSRGCVLAEELGDYGEVSHSEGVLSVALGFIGSWTQAWRRAQSCAARAEKLADPVRSAGAMFYLTVLGEARFDPVLGVEATYDLLRFVEQRQIGGLYLQMGTIFGGRHQFHLGRLDRARVMLQNALKLAEVTKIGMGIGWAHAFLGDVQFVSGNFEEAQSSYEKALEIGNQRSDEYAAPLALSGLCHLQARTSGTLEQCSRYGDEALERFDKAHNRTAKVHCLQRYAEALQSFDPDKSRRLLQQRDGLIEELGADPGICDWWPRPPEWLSNIELDADRRVTPVTSRFPSSRRAAIWKQLNSEPAPASARGTDADNSTLVDESGAPVQSTLIRQLSTPGTPLPEFASK